MLVATLLTLLMASPAMAQTTDTVPNTTGPIATLVSSVLGGGESSSPSGGSPSLANETPSSGSQSAAAPTPTSEASRSSAASGSKSSSSSALPSSSIWFYSQPPIPANTAATPPQAFELNSEPEPPQTRQIKLKLSTAAGSPDGFLRQMSVINDQFPGPLIQASIGDTLEITVENDLSIPQSIHWHGIRQNRTGFMDGVPGVAQCPIPPGESFTYRYNISTFGTYWYHSHYGNTLADGLYGALIAYSPDDPIQRWRDFDFEQVMFVSDWYDDQSALIVNDLHNASKGYRGQAIPTMPDAVLINGVGQTDCSKAQPGVQCNQTQPAETTGRIDSRLKLRLINPGSEAEIRFSVDQHVLKVVEVDDTPIQPLYMHELTLAPGQRYSVVLHLNQGGDRDAFWIRARLAAACIFGGFEKETRAVLRYTDWFGKPWSNDLPDTLPWPDRVPTDAPCIDIDNTYTVVPLQEEPLGPEAAQGRLDSSAGKFVDPVTGAPFLGFGLDSGNGTTTYTNYIEDPILKQVEDGRPINVSHLAHLTFEGGNDGTSAGILLNQLDVGLAHPFHLHGQSFHIVARGKGNMTLEGLANVHLNLTNPLRRDTIIMPSASWAYLRVPMDDPGVWPIHCHLGWHLGQGKLGVIVMRPDIIKGFDQPQDWLGLCNGDLGQIGPSKRDGRRALPELEPEAKHIEERDVVSPELEERYFSMNTASYVLVESNTVAGSQAGQIAVETSTVFAGSIAIPPAAASSAPAAPGNSPYDKIPSDPEAAWNAPGVIGNVTVGNGKTPLDSARQEGLLSNGTQSLGANGTAVSGSGTQSSVSATVAGSQSAPGGAPSQS